MDSKKDKALEMETKSIPKLVINYSAVTFCALFFNELYNIVDTLFVSKGIGDNAMGGVSIIFPFMLIQGAVAQTVGAGAASIVSRLLGKKEYEKAGNVTANAMCIFYITAFIITVLGLIFINPLLTLFGATGDILPYAKEYFTIILIGNVFSTGFSSIMRAEGRMVYSLLIWLIPTAINIALDALFIYGLDMGVKGAALATVISYFSSFVMCIIFFKKLSVQSFKMISIKRNTIREIIALGIPMLLQLGGVSLLFMVINKTLALKGGTSYLNAFAYAGKIITFAIVPYNAVSTAVSPIISYNFGADKKVRVKKSFNFSLMVCEIYSVIGIIIAAVLSEYLIRIFTADDNIILLGSEMLKSVSPALLFLPAILLTGSYFQATGKKTAAFLSNGLILILACVLIPLFAVKSDTMGVFSAITISCLLSAVISLILKQYTKNR